MTAPSRSIKEIFTNNGRLVALYDPKDFQWRKNEEGEWICLNCGKSLAFNRRLRTYCSDVCRREYITQKYLSWSTYRERVFERDAYTCMKCGRKVYLTSWTENGFEPRLRAECDHIVPLFLGDKDWYDDLELKNFQTLCSDCHKEKTIEEAKERTNLSKLIRDGKQKILDLEDAP